MSAAPNETERFRQLLTRAQSCGLETSIVVNTFEKIVEAIEARQLAIRLKSAGDHKGSADAGDLALQTAIEMVQTIAGPELDRILLSGLLGVPLEDPNARSPQLLSKKLDQLRRELNGGAAADLSRTDAREGLARVLLAVRHLIRHCPDEPQFRASE